MIKKELFINPSDLKVNSHSLSYGILLIPIFIHLLMVYTYTINMPYLDDYTFIVDCINLKIAHLAPGQLLKTVFYPHGEHIIIFARLVAMLDYLLEGELNFRTLFFIGNATLLGTIWILYRLARQGGLSVLQTLPIFWLLLQPQFYENTLTWAICALQHVPALFFAFSAFYLLSQSSSRSFWGSLPLAFLATFSNGNGLAVLVVGFLVVTVCRSRQYALIWLLFAAISGGIFYYFSQFSAAAPVSGNLSHPFRVLGGFFLMSGSMGLLFTRSLTALSLIGIGLTMVFALVAGMALIWQIAPAYWLRYAPYWLRNRVGRWSELRSQPVSIGLIAGYLYLVITLAGISFARGQGWHYGLILPRFIWFATVALVVGYLMIMLWVKPEYRKTIGWSVVCFSLVFNTFSYWSSVSEVKIINQSLLSDFHNWRENRLLITMPANKRGNDSFYATLMESAIREGVYKMPPAPLDLANRRQTSPVSLNALVTKDSSFSLDERRYRYLTINSRALAPVSQQPFSQTATYLLLRSARHTFLWPINQSRTKLSLFVVTGRPLEDSPLATIMTDMLPAARYQLGICYAQKGRWITMYSAETMQVSGSY